MLHPWSPVAQKALPLSLQAVAVHLWPLGFLQHPQLVAPSSCGSCHRPRFLAGLCSGTAVRAGASGSAFYWFSVFCAVLRWLLWPILKEVCLALAAVLSRSETENSPCCNFNWHNGTFSTDFSRLELIWGFPSVKAKLNSVSPWMKSQGLAAVAMAWEDTVRQRELRGSDIPPCWLSFRGPWYKPMGTTASCMQLPWSLLPTLPPPKLGLGQPGLKLHFHPPHSDHSHGWADLCGV